MKPVRFLIVCWLGTMSVLSNAQSVAGKWSLVRRDLLADFPESELYYDGQVPPLTLAWEFVADANIAYSYSPADTALQPVADSLTYKLRGKRLITRRPWAKRRASTRYRIEKLTADSLVVVDARAVGNIVRYRYRFSRVSGVAIRRVSVAKKRSAGGDSAQSMVERLPQYPGGQRALHQFLVGMIQYLTGIPRDNGNSMIMVSFIVNDQGKAASISVVSTPDLQLAKAAMDAVSRMPAWQPGTRNGKPVPMRYSLPVVITHLSDG